MVRKQLSTQIRRDIPICTHRVEHRAIYGGAVLKTGEAEGTTEQFDSCHRMAGGEFGCGKSNA
jgi:hypothetical protein